MANSIAKEERKEPRRMEIWLADLGEPKEGSFLTSMVRPVLIVSNDKHNHFGQSINIIPITSKINKLKLPVHVFLGSQDTGLFKDSYLMTEQTRTIDKSDLKKYILTLPKEYDEKVNKALTIQMIG